MECFIAVVSSANIEIGTTWCHQCRLPLSLFKSVESIFFKMIYYSVQFVVFMSISHYTKEFEASGRHHVVVWMLK